MGYAETRLVVYNVLESTVDKEVERVLAGNVVGCSLIAEVLLGYDHLEVLGIQEVDIVPTVLAENVICGLELENLEPSIRCVAITEAL